MVIETIGLSFLTLFTLQQLKAVGQQVALYLELQ